MILLRPPHQVFEPLWKVRDRRQQQPPITSLEATSRRRRAGSPGTSAGAPTKTPQIQLHLQKTQPLQQALQSPRESAGALMRPLPSQSRSPHPLRKGQRRADERDGAQRSLRPSSAPLHLSLHSSLEHTSMPQRRSRLRQSRQRLLQRPRAPRSGAGALRNLLQRRSPLHLQLQRHNH